MDSCSSHEILVTAPVPFGTNCFFLTSWDLLSRAKEKDIGFRPQILVVSYDITKHIQIEIATSIKLSEFQAFIQAKVKTRLESTGASPGISNLDFDLWTLDFFYGLRMTQDYQLNLSLS